MKIGEASAYVRLNLFEENLSIKDAMMIRYQCNNICFNLTTVKLRYGKNNPLCHVKKRTFFGIQSTVFILERDSATFTHYFLRCRTVSMQMRQNVA